MTTNEASITAQAAAVAAQGAQVAPEEAPSKKGASQKKGTPKGQRRTKAAKRAAKPKAQKKDSQSKATGEKPFAREGTAKAKVIALIQRKDGATMDELRHATCWQPHTVRGVISMLGKHGMKVESRRREDGARVYEAVK